MHSRRSFGHSATLLLDGRVLVAGGSTGDGGLVLATAELYDPQLGSWAPTGSMNEAHYSHTATLLADGRVLVTGGSGWSQFMGSSELYDPTSGTWTATGGLIDARLGHTASLLPDGTVLVAGGIGDGGCCGLALRSAEIYEPGTGTWAQGAWMAQGRGRHSATTLADGAVLVAGGRDDGDHVLASAEIYDARRAVWTPAASMERARSSHTATLLPDGAVLLAGGVDDDDLLQVDIWDPRTGRWVVVGSTITSPEGPGTATLLADGRVLVTGGTGADGLGATAELFDATGDS